MIARTDSTYHVEIWTKVCEYSRQVGYCTSNHFSFRYTLSSRQINGYEQLLLTTITSEGDSPIAIDSTEVPPVDSCALCAALSLITVSWYTRPGLARLSVSSRIAFVKQVVIEAASRHASHKYMFIMEERPRP